MAHPVTAPIVGQMLQAMQEKMGPMMGGGAEENANTLGTDTAMMEAMMKGMPLKSLASFAGAEAAAQIEQMKQVLNQALGNV